jgi:hypothetical protein
VALPDYAYHSGYRSPGDLALADSIRVVVLEDGERKASVSPVHGGEPVFFPEIDISFVRESVITLNRDS